MCGSHASSPPLLMFSAESPLFLPAAFLRVGVRDPTSRRPPGGHFLLSARGRLPTGSTTWWPSGVRGDVNDDSAHDARPWHGGPGRRGRSAAVETSARRRISAAVNGASAIPRPRCPSEPAGPVPEVEARAGAMDEGDWIGAGRDAGGVRGARPGPLAVVAGSAGVAGSGAGRSSRAGHAASRQTAASRRRGPQRRAGPRSARVTLSGTSDPSTRCQR
jgi:hypothetical protein